MRDCYAIMSHKKVNDGEDFEIEMPVFLDKSLAYNFAVQQSLCDASSNVRSSYNVIKCKLVEVE